MVQSAYAIAQYFNQHEVCVNTRLFTPTRDCADEIGFELHHRQGQNNRTLTAQQALDAVRANGEPAISGRCSEVTQIAPLAGDTQCHTVRYTYREGDGADPSPQFETELVVDIAGAPLTFTGTKLESVCGSGGTLLFMDCGHTLLQPHGCAPWNISFGGAPGNSVPESTLQEGFAVHALFGFEEPDRGRLTHQTLELQLVSGTSPPADGHGVAEPRHAA